MLVKPTKVVLAVGLITVMLGAASLMLVAADSHGAGAMTKLEPGGLRSSQRADDRAVGLPR
jgi:hypothetical protein